jgi:hypothetical protein
MRRMRRIARKLLKLNDLYPPQILLRRIGLLRRLALQSDAIQRLSNAPEWMPVPEPEPEPTFVEPGTPLNAAPQANAHDLANLVLSHLEKFWHCRKIPGESLRRIITTNCGKQANAVWKLLFPAHIVKFHTTDFFIFRDHKLRPKGFDGLIDYEGVLPSDEPALF